MLPASLIYILDYGLCFVSKMYKKAFKIVNKSTDRSFRFQWSVHPYVVFEPSVGHIKYLTSKEIVATFLAPEPTNQENVRFQNETCCRWIVNEIISKLQLSRNNISSKIRYLANARAILTVNNEFVIIIMNIIVIFRYRF